MLSKESVLSCPLLCWLYDVQHEGIGASLRRRWALYFLVLVVGAAVLWYFAGWILMATFTAIHLVWRQYCREILLRLLVSGFTISQ